MGEVVKEVVLVEEKGKEASSNITWHETYRGPVEGTRHLYPLWFKI